MPHFLCLSSSLSLPSPLKISFSGSPLPHRKRNPNSLAHQARPLVTPPALLTFWGLHTAHQVTLIAVSQDNQLAALGLYTRCFLNTDCSLSPSSLQRLHWFPGLGLSMTPTVPVPTSILGYAYCNIMARLHTHPCPNYNEKFQDGVQG